MQSFIRAGAIIEKNGSYLFMKRIKNGHTYYAILGGHAEPGETPAQTAIREILEETNLTITVGDVICVTEEYGTKKPGYYFRATTIKGKEFLGGPEAEVNNPENYFELAWVPKVDIKNILLFPTEVHQYLMNSDSKVQ